MNYIGMDIHKKFTVAIVKDEQGEELAKEKFDNSKENFGNFLQVYDPKETKIVMESTGVWEYIYEILDELNYQAILANPVKTKAIACARIKTDTVDASTLCDLLRGNLVAESYIPPKKIRRLREITRERRTFVKQTTQLKNRIHAILTKRGMKVPTVTLCKKALVWLRKQMKEENVVQYYVDLLEYHAKKLEEIDKEIREIAKGNVYARLLMSVPGIAGLRALTIAAEIGEIERFETAPKLASYAGLVPSIRQSGDSLRFGRLVKQSSKILKGVLIEACWSAVATREQNQLGKFYRKLKKKRGSQKAICATARKMCVIIHSMLRKKKEFIIL